MWDRKQLKENAKALLRKFYWPAFAASLILTIVGGLSVTGPFGGGGGNSGRGGSSGGSGNIWNGDGSDAFAQYLPRWQYPAFLRDGFNLSSISPEALFHYFAFFLAGAALLMVVFAIVWRVFLGYPVEVGCRRFFMNLTEERHDFQDIRLCFTNDYYWNVVKTMFMRALFNTLWYLALIIPGIVKAYAYSMVPYILSDNPQMPYDEAISLSQEMTRGYKWDLFVLDLSFVGWYLLGLLLCGLGGLFVNPYYLSTQVQVYQSLRAGALERGLCAPERLNVNL